MHFIRQVSICSDTFIVIQIMHHCHSSVRCLECFTCLHIGFWVVSVLLVSQNRMAQTGEYEQGLLNDSHRMVSSVLVEVDESYEQSDDVFLI